MHLGTSEAFSEITISSNRSDSSIATCRSALSTIAAAVGPPYRSSRSFSRDPEFTPIRIGIPRSCAARATASTRARAPMFPGLIRSLSTPRAIASNASRWLKWMSATKGMEI